MSKVILQDRAIKKITLPECGAEVEVYASILAVDLQGVSMKNLEGNDDNISDAIKLLSRLIKSWNIFAGENDDAPREVNEENIGLLPIQDLTFLLTELQSFVASEKKS
jgi:hypothetical protein|tara:strand:+ start:1511 stop:1834 length:324 start_codon:yes stop_codon:yes gene_type:complete